MRKSLRDAKNFRRNVFKEEPIKVERYILASLGSFNLILEPAKSVYLLVPKNIVNLIKEIYGLDLSNKEFRKNLSIVCNLAEEQSSGGEIKLRLVFDLIYSRKRGGEKNVK